ncbi:MAG: prephenate dehydrogenase/arogenate dehydrogenase family protein [Planctomycetota bacterium]
MPQPPLSPPLEEIVAIVGIGLIGGSLAAALRQRKVARRVIGVGRDASRLEAARQAGLIDEGSTDLAEVARRANLIVFCTPVERVAEGVRTALAGLASDSSLVARHLPLLLTDAGSVKGPICEALADVPNFIGAHPIAGSHRQGFEAAEANLFEGKVCVLTPRPSAEADRVQRLERFWQSVGMRTVTMTSDDHDRALAMTSHLPHVVASSLAATLSPENRSLTGTGFRDTTRVAAGDPDLWSGILLNNVSHVVAGIEDVQHRLESFRTALKLGNADVLKQLLEEGRTSRDTLI